MNISLRKIGFHGLVRAREGARQTMDISRPICVVVTLAAALLTVAAASGAFADGSLLVFSKSGQLEEMEDAHQMLLSSLADKIEDVLSEDGQPKKKQSAEDISESAGTPVSHIFQESSPDRNDN